jgi:hypothetical protein
MSHEEVDTCVRHFLAVARRIGMRYITERYHRSPAKEGDQSGHTHGDMGKWAIP